MPVELAPKNLPLGAPGDRLTREMLDGNGS